MMSKNRIQCEDIINLEKPKMPAISKNGKKIAFLVEKSNIENNSVRDTLYIHDVEFNSTSKLITLDKIKLISWRDESCYFLAKDAHVYKLIRIQNERVDELITSTTQLANFAVSHDESQIFFSQLITTDQAIVKKSLEEGYVYRWGSDDGSTIMNRQYQHYEFEEIWCLDITTQNKEFITKFPWKNWTEWTPEVTPLIENMSLSHNSSLLSVCLNRMGRPELGEASFLLDVLVVDISRKTSYKLLDNNISSKLTPCWVGNDEMVFQEVLYDQGKEKYILWLWDNLLTSYKKLDFTFNKRIKSMAWSNDENLLFAESSNTVHKLSLVKSKMESLHLPAQLFNQKDSERSTSWDQACNYLVSVFESRINSPQVVLYDLSSNKITQITSLNEYINNVSLGEIEAILIEVDEHIQSQGYLIHPHDYVSGKRYPLIIATYGFSGNTFSANAEEWHSSFPAQVLSKEGYLVLLLNIPPMYSQANTVDSKKARDELGWHMLRVFERAVTVLDEKKLIDIDKVGIYGWSHGAFVVKFLICHSNKFKVACLGEGGDYSPSYFWAGEKSIIEVCKNIFGGPPWGDTLKNYLDFSPFFYVENIIAPVLMEFCGGAVGALEMYAPLRYLNIPSELVLYEGEDHNFVKPRARLASMCRKVDWFNYWFFNKRAPNKPDQYDRWDQLKNQR